MARVVRREELNRVAARLQDLVGGLDPEYVTARLWVALEAIRRLVCGVRVLLAGWIDESSAPREAGLRNGAEWMAKTSGGSPAAGLAAPAGAP